MTVEQEKLHILPPHKKYGVNETLDVIRVGAGNSESQKLVPPIDLSDFPFKTLYIYGTQI